jgi:hypothetical protein
MSEKHVRLQMAAEVAQIFVRPRRPRLAIETGFRMNAIPAETESISVRSSGGLKRAQTLSDERMNGLCDVLFECPSLSSISDPPAH